MFPWLYIFLWVRKNYIHSSKNFSNKKSMYVSKRLHYACRPVAISPSFLPLHPFRGHLFDSSLTRKLRNSYFVSLIKSTLYSVSTSSYRFSFLIFWKRYIDLYASDILHISNVLCVSFDSWLVFCFNFCFYRNKE